MHVPAQVDPGEAPPARRGLRFVGLLVGAVLTAVLLGQLAEPDPSQRFPIGLATTAAPASPEPGKPIGVESLKRCPVQLRGLALRDHQQVPGWALDRWDCDAPQGPWSVVIRSNGGHFGVHGAVATFPVDHAGAGTPAPKPQGAVWDPGVQRLVWPLAGSHAQIVGDVGQVDLADLAMGITVTDGKPHLTAMNGYNTAATIPYRSPLVHEIRYSTTDLGLERKLGSGSIYTGATAGASFESNAYEARAKPAGLVRGKPAIFYDVPSGDGILAWEPALGEVDYIGISGSTTPAGAIEALRALAEKGRPLSPARWQTKDRIPSARSS